MINIFKQLEKIFMKPKADEEADDKAHKKAYEKANEKAEEKQMKKQTNEKKLDTTVMPELDSKKSAEQRRNKKGQGIKNTNIKSNA